MYKASHATPQPRFNSLLPQDVADQSVEWMYDTPNGLDRRTLITDPPNDLTLSQITPRRGSEASLVTEPVVKAGPLWPVLAAITVMAAVGLLTCAVVVGAGAMVALFLG